MSLIQNLTEIDDEADEVYIPEHLRVTPRLVIILLQQRCFIIKY